jgi:Flp pilus assembly protein TadG
MGMQMTRRLQYLGRKLGASERGTAFVMITTFIIALFGFAALSIDVANVYREQHKEHVATDAAAIAGVAKVADPLIPAAAQKAAAILEAQVIANTNSVTDAEISAGTTSGVGGQIQVGLWTNKFFKADATPYNAVRVPARRSVPLYFGKVVGLSKMKPIVDSVAVIGAIAIPYAVPSNIVGNVGGTITLQRWSPGNWGPIDLCGVLNGQGETSDAISGGGCFATIGQVTGTATGFDGVKNGFADRYKNNPITVLPVTSTFPNGNKDVTIVDFILVQLLDDGSGGGSNWQLNVLVLARGLSALGSQYTQRSLVE